MKTSSKLILIWSLELAGFSYRMVHSKGSLNTNADVLSRSDFLDDPTDEDIADFKQDLHKLAPSQTYEEQLRAIEPQKITKIS